MRGKRTYLYDEYYGLGGLTGMRRCLGAERHESDFGALATIVCIHLVRLATIQTFHLLLRGLP